MENVDVCVLVCVCVFVCVCVCCQRTQLDLEYKVELIFCVQWFQFQVQFSNPLLYFLDLYYACTTLRLIQDLARFI